MEDLNGAVQEMDNPNHTVKHDEVVMHYSRWENVSLEQIK